MKLAPSLLLLPWLAASLLACDSSKGDAAKTEAAAKTPAKADASAKDQLAVKAEMAEVTPSPELTPSPTAGTPTDAAAKPPQAPPADPNADVVLDEMKDWYGLKVVEIDGWKPSWEADTVGIQWSKPGHVDVSMGLHPKPIEKVEDIEIGFMAGTKLTKQDPPTKTAKGWYTIVTTDYKDTQGFIYVRRVGESWLVCDTLVSRGEGDDRPTVPTEKLVEICDSANST